MSKGNFYIFDRKELVILLILLALVALLAFTLGVKLGRELQFPPEVAETSEDVDQPNGEAQLSPESKDSSLPLMEAQINQKIAEDAEAKKEESNPEVSKMQEATTPEVAKTETTPVKEAVAEAKPLEKQMESLQKAALQEDHQAGPPPVYTLQVGSYRTLAEAEKQRNFIRTKGFPAQVVQADLGKKGVWYRVSVGSFGKKREALDYGKKFKKTLPSVAYILQRL